MSSFPDESKMELSKDGTEPIRGGSIGLNRILGRFVARATTDKSPEFTTVLISAFTLFRNVWTMDHKKSIRDLEHDFVTDLNLFIDYYDTYLSFTKSPFMKDKQCPVIVYFPSYKWVDKKLLRENTGHKKELFDKYAEFLRRYDGLDHSVRKTENVNCFWISAGHASFPHKEVARKCKEIVSHNTVYYTSGDPIALISHMVLDYHISNRLRSVHLLESYTGEFKSQSEFRFKLDKEGRIPFNTTTHVVFGDSVFIKPMVTPKIRKALLEQASKEVWLTRREEDILSRISKTANIPTAEIRRYDF